MLTNDDKCRACIEWSEKNYRTNARKEKINNTPAQLNAPLSRTNPHRIALALKESRKENKALRQRIANELDNKVIEIDDDIADDINFIMSNTDDNKISPSMHLFW